MATIVKRYFINVLNLSQLTTVKTGTKINPTKAREVLDAIFGEYKNKETIQVEKKEQK